MGKYKITHEKAKCIGCGACVTACPEFWEMREGKSFLKGSKEKKGIYELELSDLGCNKAAEESCPIGIIHIKEIK